jgi:hypothetical protein
MVLGWSKHEKLTCSYFMDDNNNNNNNHKEFTLINGGKVFFFYHIKDLLKDKTEMDVVP